jgi:hypothetical protein
MAKISETELQRRLRSLEKRVPEGGAGGSSYVGVSDPSGTNYNEGDTHYDSDLNNLWVFSGDEWELSSKQLHIRYANTIVNVSSTGTVSNQNQVTGFSIEPFTTAGDQKLWRGLWWGSSRVASTDPTDYEWTYTSGLGAISVDIYASDGTVFRNDTGETTIKANVSIGGALATETEHDSYDYKWTLGSHVICVDAYGNVVSDGLGVIYTDTTAVSCQTRNIGYHRADSSDSSSSQNFREITVSADDIGLRDTIRCEVSNIP